MKEIKDLVGLPFDGEVSDKITEWAKNNDYTVNVIPDNVDNIDVDFRRLNVWLDSTGKIVKFTRN